VTWGPWQRAHPFVCFATVVQSGREWVLWAKSIIELNEDDVAILHNISDEVFSQNMWSDEATTEEIEIFAHDLHFQDHLQTNLLNEC